MQVMRSQRVRERLISSHGKGRGQGFCQCEAVEGEGFFSPYVINLPLPGLHN